MSADKIYDVQGVFSDHSVNWYIVQVYIGFEDAVRRNLELKISNMSMQDKIQEIYIPTRKVLKLDKKGERQEKVEKVYPGYIYIKCVLDKEVGYIIQNTQYVSRIAGTGDYAVPLEKGYVEKLKEKLSNADEKPVVGNINDYKLGQSVMVAEGPFKDMEGKISGIDTQTSRVTVMLTIFGRESNVELDILEVKKI